MELNFKGCRTKEDVEDVFDKKEREIEKTISDLGKIRTLFFDGDEDVSGKDGKIKKGGKI